MYDNYTVFSYMQMHNNKNQCFEGDEMLLLLLGLRKIFGQHKNCPSFLESTYNQAALECVKIILRSYISYYSKT